MFDCFKSGDSYNKVDDQSLISNEITISKDHKDIQTAIDPNNINTTPANPIKQSFSKKSIAWFKESFISAGSVRGTIFILCASAMGPSTTTVPIVFNHNGIVAGVVLLFLGGLFSGLYYQVMFKSALKSKTNTYYDCIVHYFGRKLGIFVQSFIILLTFSIYTANQVMGCNIWYSFFQSLGISYFQDEQPPTNLMSVSTIIKLAQAVIILPLCLKRNLSALRYLTFFVVCIQIYVMGLIIVAYPIHPPIQQAAPGPVSYEYFTFNINLLITFTIFLFIYSAQPQIYPLKKEMRHPTLNKTSKAVTRSISMMFVIFCIIGIFGYLTFGNNIGIFNMYIQIPMTGSLGKAMIVAQILLGVLVILGLPLNLNPGRAGMVVLIKGKDEQLPMGKHFVYTVTYMLASLAIVLFYPKILSILSLAGGLVVGTIGILIPGFLYVKMSKKPLTHWWNLAVAIFSIVLTLVGYAGSIASVFYKK